MSTISGKPVAMYHKGLDLSGVLVEHSPDDKEVIHLLAECDGYDLTDMFSERTLLEFEQILIKEWRTK